ncbi:low temperature requirement protein A, partial [Psychrobacter celer]
ILNKERRHHDSFLFGYGHFFIFASIAGLGSMLNLITESVAGDNGNVISQTYAMGMLSGMLSVFLLTLTI